MALQLIKDAYVQYEKAVNALVAITKAEGYEIGEREAEAIKFYNKALGCIRQKLEAVEDTTEYMGWCMQDVAAYRLLILGEHFTHPTCLQRPRTAFENQTLICFEKMEYLTSAKALELYRNL